MPKLAKGILLLMSLVFSWSAYAAADEIGCLRGDCISDYGILVQETERGLTRYRGEFRQGEYHGTGRLDYLDGGETYKGRWMMGKKQGRGIM